MRIQKENQERDRKHKKKNLEVFDESLIFNNVTISSGYFEVRNNTITAYLSVMENDFKYEFEMVRKTTLKHKE